MSSVRHLPSLTAPVVRADVEDEQVALQRRKQEWQALFADELAEIKAEAVAEGLSKGRLAAEKEVAQDRANYEQQLAQHAQALNAELEQHKRDLDRELQQGLTSLEQVRVALEQHFLAQLADWESIVLPLVLECLGKLLIVKADDRDLMTAIVRGALRHVGEESQWKISVSPETADRLSADAFWREKVVVDAAKGTLDCEVITPNQRINAALDKQLAALVATLASACGRTE